jgi:hypothetical protein
VTLPPTRQIRVYFLKSVVETWGQDSRCRNSDLDRIIWPEILSKDQMKHKRVSPASGRHPTGISLSAISGGSPALKNSKRPERQLSCTRITRHLVHLSSTCSEQSSPKTISCREFQNVVPGAIRNGGKSTSTFGSIT